MLPVALKSSETRAIMLLFSRDLKQPTAETVVDRKEAVSAGDRAACFQKSRSLPTLTVSPVDFRPPVSVSKNSVPGD
jgi:hypothetical protein